jgi:hypothetical protein
MSVQLFAVHLLSAASYGQDEAQLRQALRPAGHDVWLDADEEGRPFLAVRMRGPWPLHDLESLLRQAGLSAYCVPLWP